MRQAGCRVPARSMPGTDEFNAARHKEMAAYCGRLVVCTIEHRRVSGAAPSIAFTSRALVYTAWMYLVVQNERDHCRAPTATPSAKKLQSPLKQACRRCTVSLAGSGVVSATPNSGLLLTLHTRRPRAAGSIDMDVPNAINVAISIMAQSRYNTLKPGQRGKRVRESLC